MFQTLTDWQLVQEQTHLLDTEVGNSSNHSQSGAVHLKTCSGQEVYTNDSYASH